MKNFNVKKVGIWAGSLVTALTLVLGSVYTVQEGNIGIVKRWGEAIDQVDPGMNFKVPFIDSVKEIDIRTQKYTLILTASTTGTNEKGESELQMPSTVTVSANWNIPKDQALKIFIDYGSLAQYEDRILDPRVTRSVKQIFPQYDIETIISDREAVRSGIEVALIDSLAGEMVKMTAINLENVKFHSKIAAAVTKKQVAKLQLQEQRDILATQALKAAEKTNIADAEAAGIALISIQKAAAIAREGLAEAASITAKAKALGNNTNIIKLTEAQNWDGKLPSTILGSGNMPILDMRKN